MLQPRNACQVFQCYGGFFSAGLLYLLVRRHAGYHEYLLISCQFYLVNYHMAVSHTTSLMVYHKLCNTEITQ